MRFVWNFLVSGRSAEQIMAQTPKAMLIHLAVLSASIPHTDKRQNELTYQT